MEDASLSNLVLRALTNGDASSACLLADRLCRLDSAPNPVHLSLLGVALEAKGETAAAEIAFKKAVALDPENGAATSFLRARGQSSELPRPDYTVFRHHHSWSDVVEAAVCLIELCGEPLLEIITGRNLVRVRAASLVHMGAKLDVSWHDGKDAFQEPVLRRSTDRAGVVVEELVLANRPGPASLDAKLWKSRRIVAQCAKVTSLDPTHRFEPKDDRNAGERGVLNIIVPVYGDPVAIAACLQSICNQRVSDTDVHTIIVNDASPDSEVREIVEKYRGRRLFTVLDNRLNLGFVGAVNYGLTAALSGDVLLLNSDTVLPSSAVSRFRAILNEDPEIGTLTPFTNSGQIVSFPTPYESALAPTPAQTEQLADSAWKANGTATVAIPSGVGFCLYVRAECMRRAKYLDQEFGRGYYEDTDLCQRIAQAGWKNACATGIFVSHSGTRSFGSEKWGLVNTNRKVLDARYPIFGPLTASFVEADPLRPFRERIERSIASKPGSAVLIVAGDSASLLRAQDVAAQEELEGRRAMVGRSDTTSAQAGLHIRAVDGTVPQNTFVALGDPTALRAFFKWQRINKVLFLDPASADGTMLDVIVDLGISICIDEGDGGLYCPRRHFINGAGVHCGVPSDPGVCNNCVAEAGSAAQLPAGGVADWRARWAETVFGSAAGSRDGVLARLARVAIDAGPGRVIAQPGSCRRLGLVPLFRTVHELVLLRHLAIYLCDPPAIEVVVIGDTVDDGRLLELPSTFVTGPVSAEDVGEVINRYEISSVLIATRRFHARHPVVAALAATGLPLARTVPPALMRTLAEPGRLVLSAASSAEDLASEFLHWVMAADPWGKDVAAV